MNCEEPVKRTWLGRRKTLLPPPNSTKLFPADAERNRRQHQYTEGNDVGGVHGVQPRWASHGQHEGQHKALGAHQSPCYEKEDSSFLFHEIPFRIIQSGDTPFPLPATIAPKKFVFFCGKQTGYFLFSSRCFSTPVLFQ